MEGIFIGFLFLSGCLTFSTCLLHQYHFVSDAMNWTEAQSYCREKYTDLAIIENTEEIKKLKDTVSAAGNSSEVWIGLYSHVDWKWSDGFNQSGADYRNWSHPDPNDYAANQLCVIMTSHGTWFDDYCHKENQFVCYNGTLEDSDFVLVSTKRIGLRLRGTAENTTQIWPLCGTTLTTTRYGSWKNLSNVHGSTWSREETGGYVPVKKENHLSATACVDVRETRNVL
ncbi:unnamed protein product [Pleuronectes platessa]|uniref:C-type lectin domain-containing protein n=1 Tax=Pleuronectes platessa TaxID=8262 RepID=A0A9N7TY02_PLEPL|nr:unnamed protein product [Pleuronectes platessa]